MCLTKQTLGLLALYAGPALAAFGVTTSDDSYVLDAGSSTGLVVTVSRTDGSLTSIVYGDTEYQSSEKTSHIASGLGDSDVSYTIVDSSYNRTHGMRNIIMLTAVQASTSKYQSPPAATNST